MLSRLIFRIALAEVLAAMRNEFDETLDQLNISWRKVSEKLIDGEISFRLEEGYSVDCIELDLNPVIDDVQRSRRRKANK